MAPAEQITVTGRWGGDISEKEAGWVQIYMITCHRLTLLRDLPHCKGASCRCSKTSWLRTPSTLASPLRCRDGWAQSRKKPMELVALGLLRHHSWKGIKKEHRDKSPTASNHSSHVSDTLMSVWNHLTYFKTWLYILLCDLTALKLIMLHTSCYSLISAHWGHIYIPCLKRSNCTGHGVGYWHTNAASKKNKYVRAITQVICDDKLTVEHLHSWHLE